MKKWISFLVVFAIIACGKDKDSEKEISEVLSQNACLKSGEYCYVPKPGVGFAESSCKEDGGTVVLTCDGNPALKCNTESMTISLYGDFAKDVACADVGQKI